MKLLLAALTSIFAAGCVVTVGGKPFGSGEAEAVSDGNVIALDPEPGYSEARAKLSAADAELESDPAAAERDYLAARVELFQAYNDFHKRQGRDGALAQALGLGIDNVRHFGPPSNEIFWRSVIGRTKALKKLGREVETLTEIPRWRVQAGFDDGMRSGGFSAKQRAEMHKKVLPAVKLCPSSLGTACADHVAWLQSRFPQIEVGEYGPGLKADFTIGRNETELMDLPNVIKKLPDQTIVFLLTVAAAEKAKDGTATLIRDGVELGVTSGTDTGKRRLAIENDKVVVKRVMTNVSHDVVHSNSVSIHLSPGQDFALGQVKGGDILVYANVKKGRTTREGPRTRLHIDKPFVISFEGRYQYGVDLTPMWKK